MITKENYKNIYEVNDTPHNTVKVKVLGQHNRVYEINSKIFHDNFSVFLENKDSERIMWLKTHDTQMNQTLGKIANETTWMKAKIVEISYSMNYIELILRNGLFCVVQIRNEYEAELRISKMGGFKAIIHTSEVCELINKLSY